MDTLCSCLFQLQGITHASVYDTNGAVPTLAGLEQGGPVVLVLANEASWAHHCIWQPTGPHCCLAIVFVVEDAC